MTDNKSDREGLDKMTAQPLIIDIDGRELELTRLAIDDFGALEMKTKQDLATATAAILKSIGEDRTTIVEEINNVLTRDLTPKEWTGALASPEGQAFLLMRSLNRKHPEITKDEFYGMLPINRMTEVMQRLIALDDQGKKVKNSKGASGRPGPKKAAPAKG